MITVVNKANWLRGQQYSARIQRILVTSGLQKLRAQGKYVIVTFTIQNTLGAAHEFDQGSDLVFLFVDGKYFSENPQAEGDRALDPFRLRTTALQPGQTATGTVIFDLPPADAKNVFAEGSDLIFVNYSDEAKRFPTGTQPLQALGYIRLWK